MAGRVLLYSCGLDSFCLDKIYNPEIKLFIDLGTEESKKEKKLLPKETVVLKFPLSQFELQNKIIPFRNHFLILLAAQYSNEIFLGTTTGDTTKDKDFVFSAQMESSLNYFSLDKNKVKIKEYPYKVLMPFKNLTKSEIVKEYLREGFSSDLLFYESRSCYYTDIECGKCRSCLRKYVALKNNNIDCSNKFMHNPKRYLFSFYKECVEKNRNKKELKEISDLL